MLKTSNKKLDDIVFSDLLIMEDFISRNVAYEHSELAANIISNLIKSGGKKIRPKLVFIVCKMLNYSGENRINVAAAVEFIHNATLLHDDVLDDGEARHGVKTANKIWGNKSSILVGDLLLTLAFRWLIECGNLNILSILSEASHSLVKGEIKQMTTQFSHKTMRENYFGIIEEKTASLFSACCETAAVVSGATNDETTRLKNFGFNFGMAFQIIDDVLDYTASTSGKQIGKDFFEGKITLPAIIAYENGNNKEQEFWQECFSSINIERDFNQALRYIEYHNAIQLSMEKAKHYIDAAQSNIIDSPYKTVLINFLNESIERRA
ncbi:polyprenyl synthetase family protein [Wolbachia endosymbiont of Ctenocephalides felis wCfeT]|uniref:polyprenyl synthetase family protein n=1 Tax=Wolbachia endosymbiont of Ctenocephalides felis wCfeT TaxID=2732593 RepID=UPI0014469324|nr:polyprenyl synthetase family protein [Wolbachia endosymbiont of Ctenocephalides felis wCfeT]